MCNGVRTVSNNNSSNGGGGGSSSSSSGGNTSNSGRIQSVHELRVWIPEGSTQADS